MNAPKPPAHLDEPRATGSYAGMDDMSEYASKQHQPAVLTMPTPALLAEVDEGLALRVCRRQTTARDVLLVQALAARLQTATISHALAARSLNKEPLDGALWLDFAAESNHA